MIDGAASHRGTSVEFRPRDAARRGLAADDHGASGARLRGRLAGALWAFVYLGAWEPAAFSIVRSFLLLFLLIIGGLGSIVGSLFGAAFFVLLPLFLNYVPHWLGLPLSTATATYLST